MTTQTGAAPQQIRQVYELHKPKSLRGMPVVHLSRMVPAPMSGVEGGIALPSAGGHSLGAAGQQRAAASCPRTPSNPAPASTASSTALP